MMNISLCIPCAEYWESYKESLSEMDWKECGKGMHWDGKSSPEQYFLEALRQALVYSKNELGLKKLLLTCDNNNIASIKTIEKNKGKLVESKPDQSGRLSRYYSISL